VINQFSPPPATDFKGLESIAKGLAETGLFFTASQERLNGCVLLT
jgi:hypothetical protein